MGTSAFGATSPYGQSRHLPEPAVHFELRDHGTREAAGNTQRCARPRQPRPTKERTFTLTERQRRQTTFARTDRRAGASSTANRRRQIASISLKCKGPWARAQSRARRLEFGNAWSPPGGDVLYPDAELSSLAESGRSNTSCPSKVAENGRRARKTAARAPARGAVDHRLYRPVPSARLAGPGFIVCATIRATSSCAPALPSLSDVLSLAASRWRPQNT